MLIGPNTPGIISPPEKCKVGIMPGYIHTPGPVGVISRSGTLTYEVVDQLTKAGMGQSTCLGLGGDPVVGLSFVDCLKCLRMILKLKPVVLIGEIGGSAEEQASEYIKKEFCKPVVAYVAGQYRAPRKEDGSRWGMNFRRGLGRLRGKLKALTEAGVTVVENLTKVGQAVREILL